MKVMVLNGGPRRKGNSSILSGEFIRGIMETNPEAEVEEIICERANVGFCRGCLQCNSKGHCVLKNDDWADISRRILDADILVMVSPVYFRAIASPLKKFIDRFRAFFYVRITEDGSTHDPYEEWKKDWVAILSYGSSAMDEADPVKEFFEMTMELFGPKNTLHTIIGRRLARVGHVTSTAEELKPLYEMLKIPEEWTHEDAQRNGELMASAYDLGKKLTESRGKKE